MQTITMNRAIIDEANAWFKRTRYKVNEDSPSIGISYIADFIVNFSSVYPQAIKSILEVGASYGYNLNYLQSRMHLDCYGVEASDIAVQYGNTRWGDSLMLRQNLSNDIEFNDNRFDMVILGFCLYTTPRNILYDTLRECNRVLKNEGFLAITDFDTPSCYKKDNKHCEKLPVYKQDYAKCFLNMGYTLVEKHSWCHGGDCFNTDLQERVSTQILFKEPDDNVYYSII